ncbi:MAG: hypothetical protein AAB451_03000 [Patescibacteria group bacterium]
MSVRIFKLFLISLAVFLIPSAIQAAVLEFNVDPSYDYLGRSNVTAFLHQIGENALFYVEDGYYQTLDIDGKKEFAAALKNLSQEFDENIYPKLRSVFGSEWKPGIDNDGRITVLVTRIKGDAGGYFNSGDEYPTLQSPDSNQKEMVYLNASYVTSPLVKGFLAHEFTHLINFYQKDKIQGISEEIWLNEMRSELAPRILGYDDDYENSNLKRRLKSFLQKPQDSLTEWKNEASDYGVLNLFMQYMVDYYGVKILSDSLKSSAIGIASINDFSQIFTDWTIAVLVNDCNLGPKLCYLNPNLKNLRIFPQLNFLPSVGDSSLSVVNYVKNWAGNWYKFIGGQGTFKLEFIGDERTNFKVPYLLEDNSGNLTLDYLKLDSSQRATQFFPDFGKKYRSLVIIPSLQTKIAGFNGIENYSKFIFTASIISDNQPINPEEELIKNLLAQIAVLQNKIVQLLAQQQGSCLLKNNLYFGMKNNTEVRCLQQFLKVQVTGNYFSLTIAAVKKYQASKGIIQTGYFGPLTRAAVNQKIK